LILIVALFRGDPMLTTLEFALVLLVAAIPWQCQRRRWRTGRCTGLRGRCTNH